MRLPVVALRNLTVLPKMLMHFDVSRKKSVAAVERAMVQDQRIYLVCQIDENTQDPDENDVYHMGTIGVIKQLLKMPDNIVRVLVEGVSRAELIEMTGTEPFLEAEVEEAPYCEDVTNPLEAEAMVRSLKESIERYGKLTPSFAEASVKQLLAIQTLEELMDQVMIRVPFSTPNRQNLLNLDSTYARFHMLSS